MFYLINTEYTLIVGPMASIEEVNDMRKLIRQDLLWILVRES